MSELMKCHVVDRGDSIAVLTLDNKKVLRQFFKSGSFQASHYVDGYNAAIDAALAEPKTSAEPVAWTEFDAAYKKACESSKPQDWLNAALIAQQVRQSAVFALPQLSAERVREILHYPDCWDTAAYPTVYDALQEVFRCSTCTEALKEAGK